MQIINGNYFLNALDLISMHMKVCCFSISMCLNVSFHIAACNLSSKLWGKVFFLLLKKSLFTFLICGKKPLNKQGTTQISGDATATLRSTQPPSWVYIEILYNPLHDSLCAFKCNRDRSRDTTSVRCVFAPSETEGTSNYVRFSRD